MNGKVLLNVYSIGVKKDLLNILVENGYDFMEVNNPNELSFKYNLIKDTMDLYVHELDENNYQASLNQIKKIEVENVRCIVLIHEYSSKVIDDALGLKVNDIVVLPIEKDNLQKKILSTVSKAGAQAEHQAYMPSTPPPREEIKVDAKRIEDEINRAVRGDYPLSFVMIEYDRMGIEVFKVFRRELRKLLRTTDMVMKYDKKQLLLLCPFTPKSHLVEVENKVRLAHKKLSDVTVTPTRIYLYGVTFPDDGEASDALLRTMSDGIHDSMIFSNLDGTLHQMDRQALKTKLKRNY